MDHSQNEKARWWKRDLIWEVSIGFGAVIGVALIVGGINWYQSRPKPRELWNRSAIKASFNYIGSISSCPIFYYTLENTTDSDYHLNSKDGVTLVSKDESANLSLYDWRDSNGDPRSEAFFRYDLPVFVPAKQKVIGFGINGLLRQECAKDCSSSESTEMWKHRLAACVKDNKEIYGGGWVLFDSNNRYQIDFPKGW